MGLFKKSGRDYAAGIHQDVDNVFNYTGSKQLKTPKTADGSESAPFLLNFLDFLLSTLAGLVYALYRMVRAPIALAFSFAFMALLVLNIPIAIYRSVTSQDVSLTWKDFFLPPYLTNFILGAHKGFTGMLVAHLKEIGWAALLAACVLSGFSAYATLFAGSTVLPFMPGVLSTLSSWFGMAGITVSHFGWSAALGLSTVASGAIAGAAVAFVLMLGTKLGLTVEQDLNVIETQNAEVPADETDETDETDEKHEFHPVLDQSNTSFVLEKLWKTGASDILLLGLAFSNTKPTENAYYKKLNP